MIKVIGYCNLLREETEKLELRSKWERQHLLFVNNRISGLETRKSTQRILRNFGILLENESRIKLIVTKYTKMEVRQASEKANRVVCDGRVSLSVRSPKI